jgi:hypothetical protein
VTSLDNAMNNTSLILLIHAGSKSLLFPGDAQYENWSYALNQDSIMKKLSKVDVYKVGHHGSLNATPKTLWRKMTGDGTPGAQRKRMIALLSTQDDQHGHEESRTEVPRKTLTRALRSRTRLVDTRAGDPGDLYIETVIRI